MKYLTERYTHRRNLIVKARQFGFTTLHAIDYLDEAMFVRGMTCAIIAHEREAADRIFEIVKRAYTFFPDQLKPFAKYDTKRTYYFTHDYNGEVLDSAIYVAMKLRGGTVMKLHITEGAYIKDRAELVSGSKQAVPMQGWITEETTGNGFNEFFDLYSDAMNNQSPGELEYRTYFYGWNENPEYSLAGGMTEKTGYEKEIQRKFGLTDGQLLWRRWKSKELQKQQEGIGLSGEQLFKQEYPLTVMEAFQSGVGQVFDSEKVGQLTPSPVLAPELAVQKIGDNAELFGKYKYLVNHGVKIWKLPEFGKTYLAGVDPSDGEGSNNSCVDIWEKDSLEQVAQFYGLLRPDELAEMTKDMAEFYHRAYVGVENNMLSTILFLIKIYDNYYFSTTIDEKTAKKTRKIGWNTNSKTRDVMIDDFIILFEEGNLIIHSPVTIKEMKTFVRKDNGKREHADGKTDDALFAGFIALQMRKYLRRKARVFETKPF